MHILVLYDISNDRIRTKIATACEDYGLDRIQYSAFYGKLSRNHQEELMLLAGTILKNEMGRIQLIPISQTEWDKRIEVGVYVR